MIKSIKNYFKKSNSGIQSTNLFRRGFFGCLYGSDDVDVYNISASEAMEYYACIDPISDSVDRISSECASINPLIYNIDTDEFTDDHPILELINHPSGDCSKVDFIEEIAAYSLITNNFFIHAIGNINRPPIELRVIPPTSIFITNNSRGLIETISVSDGGSKSVFTRKSMGGCDRYLDGNLSELFVSRGFNPFRNLNVMLGLSPLNAIKKEIQQYSLASTYNLSQLKNGGTGTLHFAINSDLTDDQKVSLEENINKKYAGASNANRIIATDDNIKLNNLSKSATDMDFFNLKKDVSNRIYNRFKVPLSLINTESMTYSNVEAGKIMLYDNAVLPLLNKIYGKLNNFLLPRYPGSENLRISYNESTIPALALRKNEQLKTIKDLGVNTDNEIRALAGFESYEGGDKIYKPLNLVPVGEDLFTKDNLEEPDALSVYKD